MQRDRKLVLHIGRHKTGTSSIQQFLASNTSLLSKYNFLYPGSTRARIAHHEFGNNFRNNFTRTPEQVTEALNRDVATAMQAEVAGTDQNILISSESLQNARPDLIAQCFSGSFGEKDIVVSVYIRNQIDYLASAYAQKVWATSYAEDMSTFFDTIFTPDYEKFLTSWEKICNGNLIVRRFDRQLLAHKDIVADFFINTLNITDQDVIDQVLNRPVFDSNPSLTSELLAYKVLYNRSATNDASAHSEKILQSALAKLSLLKESPPVTVTSELAEQCIEACRESNKRIASKYFSEDTLFELDRPTGSVPSLSQEKLDSISNQLIETDNRLEPLISQFSTASCSTG